MNVNNLLDLYTDYLLVTPTYSTATGLSLVTDNKVSHDQITRLLSGKVDSKTLWSEAKPMVHEIRSPEGLLIIDDSIEPKKFTKTNPLINWHYDHCSGKSVKGVNFVSSYYYSPKYDMGLPVGVEFVKKDVEVLGKNGKPSHKSKETKNEMMRRMVVHANYNTGFKYVLADSWFSSSGNMSCITQECSSDFILALKSNRVVALNKEDKAKGIYQSIESLTLEERTMSVYLKQYSEPILIAKQVFKNGDGSTGTLYLATSDLNLDYQDLTAIYQKRWKVEEFFRSIKNNTAFAKAPTKTIQTQQAHFVASMIAYMKLERLKIRNSKNHYAMKSEIWLAATKAAWEQLEKLSTPNSSFNKIAA
ncbi:MAG: transposase [Flavobacteriaceae bacterium]|tara:strand:+ start:38 stop:1120 length:1083 start_codon:yes stop_codon:yes gene_type:complete